MRTIWTLERFEEARDRMDTGKRRAELTTLRCACSFEGCYGWVAEDVSDPRFPRAHQALPSFIGPLENDPESWEY